MSDFQAVAASFLRGCFEDRDKAFWQLWEQYRKYLYRCCLKWMGNPIDAEDALSRAMLKAWEKIHDCSVEIKNLKSWLTRLTHNLCVDIYRERHRGTKQFESLETIDFEYEPELVSQEENPVLAAMQQEMKNFFCLAIDQLPSKLRETFILHFEEELSYKEIAVKLNISYDNVRKRVSQARAILGDRFNQDFVGEDKKSNVETFHETSLHPIIVSQTPEEFDAVNLQTNQNVSVHQIVVDGEPQAELLSIPEIEAVMDAQSDEYKIEKYPLVGCVSQSIGWKISAILGTDAPYDNLLRWKVWTDSGGLAALANLNNKIDSS